MIYHITKADFENEVVRSPRPVVLDFYAVWCGPCRAQGKILENIDEKGELDIKICKCDVDENPDLAEMFGVETIPTLVFYKDGVKMGQYSGVLEKEGIKRMLEI
jgi:thioredoxin 1